MFTTAYDFKAFYNTREGRIVRRVLGARIRACWPDVKGLSVLGCGYAVPYMRALSDEADKIFAVMPALLGAHHWPGDVRNLVCLSEESELPFETNSLDRVLLVHSLEHAEFVRPALEEIWRVLKSSGRLLVLAPNRLGMWSRAEWSPFGHGRPFSYQQLCHQLRETLFVQEQSAQALFVPPLRAPFVMRGAAFFEGLGGTLYPALGGVHVIEASKQLYAPTGLASEARIHVRGRGLLPARAVPGARRMGIISEP